LERPQKNVAFSLNGKIGSCYKKKAQGTGRKAQGFEDFFTFAPTGCKNYSLQSASLLS
jgi:hypothetical protein